MIRNYLKVALRNIFKHRLFAFINIMGLSVGLAAVILIYLFLKDELSFDRFHNKAENLYRIAWFSGDPQTRTPHPLAQAMVRDFGEVESAVSISPLWGAGLTRQTFTIKRPDQQNWQEERDILSVDSTFFDVFSFKLLSGNPQKVLRQVGGMVISQRMAQKYFGTEDPIGELLYINDDTTILQVEGVFENVPANSHFHFDALISYTSMKAYSDPESKYYTWEDFGHFNYIRLADRADVNQLQSKIMGWVAGYLDWTEEDLERLSGLNYRLQLQPVTDIHLKSAIRWELESNGNIGYIYIMSAAALLILIIASFNFMNLTTARSMERAGEVGIRKALGATRESLYSQFLGESILLAFMSVILAGLIVEVSLPMFNALTDKDLNLDITNPATLISMGLAALIIGLASGFYPSAFLSSLQPVKILKGKHVNTKGGQSIRRILIVLQFSISMFLIAGAVVIFKQLNYLGNKSLGFNKEAVVIVPVKTNEVRNRFEALQTELTALGGVINASAASNIPGKQFNQNPIWSESDPQNVVAVSQFMVDYEIFNTLDIEFITGRNFSKQSASDNQNFIINEKAVQALNLENPIGEVLNLDMDGTIIEAKVIGVVKDFHFQSLHQPVRPMVLLHIPAYSFGLISVRMDNFSSTIKQIEQTWNEFDGNFDFEYKFLDETLENQYAKEQKMGTVFGSFAVLAILIACLGLAGIAAIDFSYKKKEIGVKKVLGAPSKDLIFSLLKEYTFIVGLSLLISAPAWWILMEQWLNNFTFKISLNPTDYLISGLVLLIIAWITLGYLTYTTVRANPVDALRDD